MKALRSNIQPLAIDGGRPLRDTPLPTALGGAMIGEEEKRAAIEVLESRSLFRYYGPSLLHKTETLEREFAASVARKHALAVSSGTAALRTALVALQIGRGDEVLIPAYSFLACPAAVITLGAMPVFVECDESLLLDAHDLESKVSERSRVVMVVHNNGAVSAMDPILEIARRHTLFVIEDCAQSHGATYHGKPAGSFGDVATFSLQYLKIITSGEGGVVAADDSAVHERAVYHHDLGFQRPGRLGPPFPGENLRMSELTAAVALEQLRKLPAFLERTRRHRRFLIDAIGDLDGFTIRHGPDPDGDQGTSLVLRFADAEAARFFRRAIRAENIPCDGCHAKLCYKYPAILGCRIATIGGRREIAMGEDGESPYFMGLCPRTEAILKRSVALTLSPAHSDRDIDDVAGAIAKVAAHLPH